jgi:hypothetical protein
MTDFTPPDFLYAIDFGDGVPTNRYQKWFYTEEEAREKLNKFEILKYELADRVTDRKENN